MTDSYRYNIIITLLQHTTLLRLRKAAVTHGKARTCLVRYYSQCSNADVYTVV